MAVRRLLAGGVAIALLLCQHGIYQAPLGAATLTLGNTAVGSQTDVDDFIASTDPASPPARWVERSPA